MRRVGSIRSNHSNLRGREGVGAGREGVDVGERGCEGMRVGVRERMC